MMSSYIALGDTKRKFLVTNIFCFLSLLSVSSVYLYLSHSLVEEQKLFHQFDSRVKKQLLLINDISSLSGFYDDKKEVDINQIKFQFKGLYRDLLTQSKQFNQWLLSNEMSEIQFIGKFFKDKKVKRKMTQYLSVAEEFVGRNENTIDEIRENIKFLSENSVNGLGDLLAEVSNAVSLKEKESLRNLELVSFALVFFSIFQFFVVWFYIYRPLFRRVVDQNEKITNSLIQVESASKSKMNFLANISHEIRTPMFIILGYVERLKSKDLDEAEREESADLVTKNANHLLSLIDEILDISKVEAGKIEYNLHEFNLEKLFAEVYGLLKIKADEKNLKLIFVNNTNLPKRIKSDSKRVKQILYNLLGNAIKFTSKGHVELRVEFKASNNKLAFYIEDTGVGIPTKSQRKIFEPFEQADESVNRKFGGTGLGLAISRSLARGLGGDLRVLRSVPGDGTTMELFVSAGATSTSDFIESMDLDSNSSLEEEVSKEANRIDGAKVLVVDDAKENTRLFYLYLNTAGAEVDLAYGGEEAVKKFTDNEYDVVLLDLQMPEVDGYQAIKRMKVHNSKVPILALTAHAMDEERVKTHNAGFSDHITKPVSAEVLVNAVISNMSK